MKIRSIEDKKKYEVIFPQDENGRCIKIFNVQDAIITGKNIFYPNTLIYSMYDKEIFKPLSEKAMSLSKIDEEVQFIYEQKTDLKQIDLPVFYFIYDTENYFHFIYDTLPYLISYFELKLKIKNLKLLMNFPNKEKLEFYDFVFDTLRMLDVTEKDILIVKNDEIYSNVFISTSYTHGHDSNLPPKKEIFELYNKIKNKVENKKHLPSKIYISRRTEIHNNFSNIGTNYTSRRKMINEDLLVELLKNKGFVEVFTENMTMTEKIQLFQNADFIIGPIGGGLVNVVFSGKDTKLITIVSPLFLEINYRFKFCLESVNNHFFHHTKHIDHENFKKYSRVLCGNIVGEIIDKRYDMINIIYDNDHVSGWNISRDFNEIWINKNECIELDSGLNSEFMVNLDIFDKYLNEILC